MQHRAVGQGKHNKPMPEEIALKLYVMKPMEKLLLSSYKMSCHGISMMSPTLEGGSSYTRGTTSIEKCSAMCSTAPGAVG